jgi:hypothetical protein
MLSVSQDAGEAAVLHSENYLPNPASNFTGHGDCRHASGGGGLTKSFGLANQGAATGGIARRLTRGHRPAAFAAGASAGKEGDAGPQLRCDPADVCRIVYCSRKTKVAAPQGYVVYASTLPPP